MDRYYDGCGHIQTVTVLHDGRIMHAREVGEVRVFNPNFPEYITVFNSLCHFREWNMWLNTPTHEKKELSEYFDDARSEYIRAQEREIQNRKIGAYFIGHGDTRIAEKLFRDAYKPPMRPKRVKRYNIEVRGPYSARLLDRLKNTSVHILSSSDIPVGLSDEDKRKLSYLK